MDTIPQEQIPQPTFTAQPMDSVPTQPSFLPQTPVQYPIPEIEPLPGEENIASTPDVQPDMTPDVQPSMEPSMQPDMQPENINVGQSTNVEEEEEEEKNEVTDDTIEEGTFLYFIRDVDNYEFETEKLKLSESEELTGCWFFTTTKTAEKICLEYWEDKFLYKYELKDNINVPQERRKMTDPCLYTELPIDPMVDQQYFLNEDDLAYLDVVDHMLLKHEFIASSYGINERRFAVIDRGEIICNADKSVVKQPRPDPNEPGCFFYITTILPEDSVLQDWEDKVLNVYYFNEAMVLPYGADNEPDPYFDTIYTDKLEGDDGSIERVFSYYDDNIEGEYIKNEPKTAEIFLVVEDLSKVSYYGSYDLKLENVKFIHSIERPMYE